MRLSASSLAGTARTLVAVGTVSETFMFLTTAAEAPRSGDCLPAAIGVDGFAAAGLVSAGLGAAGVGGGRLASPGGGGGGRARAGGGGLWGRRGGGGGPPRGG